MEDPISFYSNKLVEISNDIIALKSNFVEIQVAVDEYWKGKSGTAALERVDEINHSLTNAEEQLNDALSILGWN